MYDELTASQIGTFRTNLNKLAKRLKSQLKLGGRGIAKVSANLAAVNLKIEGSLQIDVAETAIDADVHEDEDGDAGS
jgi:hypothetical protein